MSAYLELLEEKSKLGLITGKSLEDKEKWYYLKQVKQMHKDNADAKAKIELDLIKSDKSAFLTIQVLNELNQINKSTRSTNGWITFIGIINLLGALIGVGFVLASL